MNEKRMILVEDDADFARAIAQRCQNLGINVDCISNGLDAITSIARRPPDLVILDIHIPQGDGEGVFEQMSANPRLASIPVIFLSGASSEDAIHRCESMGAEYVLKGPDAWETLEPLLMKYLHLQQEKRSTANLAATRGRVLVVDDDPDIAKIIKQRMAVRGVDVIGALGGMEGFWTALQVHPDVIITDYTMPQGRADYLIRRLKDHPVTQDVPIIVLTGRGSGIHDYGLEREMRNIGAIGYLSKPPDFDALWEMMGPLLHSTSPSA